MTYISTSKTTASSPTTVASRWTTSLARTLWSQGIRGRSRPAHGDDSAVAESERCLLAKSVGRLRRDKPGFSLHAGVSNDPNLSKDPAVRELAFNSATQELLERGLLELDYRVADDGMGGDLYGMHATDLGMVFIRQTWPNAFGGLT